MLDCLDFINDYEQWLINEIAECKKHENTDFAFVYQNALNKFRKMGKEKICQ